jgi:chromosome segregation protein
MLVDTGWETAVETVLGKKLEAIQLDDFSVLNDALITLPKGEFTLYANKASEAPSSTPSSAYLASKIQQPSSLHSLVAHIYIADDLPQALQQQATLKTGESIITRNGSWVGTHWIQFNSEDKLRDGVLARQKEIESTKKHIESLTENLFLSEERFEVSQDQQATLDNQKTTVQNQLNEQHRQQSETRSSISTLENRIKQTQHNEKRILSDITDLTQRKDSEHKAHVDATKQRNAALKQSEILSIEQDQLQHAQQDVQTAVNQHRSDSQQLRERSHTLQLQVEALKINANSTTQQIERLLERLEALKQRELAFQQESTQQAHQKNLPELLQTQLQAHTNTETELIASRTNLEKIAHRIREKENQRAKAEQQVEHFRSLLEKLKMEWQEVTVRAKTLQHALNETDFIEKELFDALDESAKIATHQQHIKEIERKISRLGAINLAAIDEYQEQNERKIYLDEQNDDLQEALELLESAIRKIDKDTRARFKDTFEQVNTRVQDMFPRLFGGGQAKIEMTGDDLLTTGVSIMARPPGKRISSIQLMSGGEKALTAVALVFAIFELNPAPFCMLDEVDAPLDEANVRRFAALVKQMSERVQFIFITHNKTTMELADNLIGVTMREPGVSRTVAVDVDAAARMVQE